MPRQVREGPTFPRKEVRVQELQGRSPVQQTTTVRNRNRMTASSCDAPEIRRTKRTKCPGSRRSPSAAGHAARRLSCGRETPRGRYQRRNPDNSRLLKWKAKLVASGDHLLDINGKHYPEQGRLGAPTKMEAIRLVCWWAGMNSTHELLQADVTGTYLQSKLGPTLWPESWRNRGLKRPVLRLR